MYLPHAVILSISVTHTKITNLPNFLRKKQDWNEKCIGIKMECGKIVYISLYMLFLTFVTWIFFLRSQTLFHHLNYMLSLNMLYKAVYLYIHVP